MNNATGDDALAQGMQALLCTKCNEAL